MSTKFKKSTATIKSVKSGTSENLLQKRLATGSKEFRGILNEGEFSYQFRKFCVECKTTLIPNVKLITADDMREMTISCSSISKASQSQGSTGTKQRSEHKTPPEDALAAIPEVLVVQDDTSNAVVEAIFRQFRVDKNMLVALTKTLKTGTSLRSLKLEFCHLTSKEIGALSVIVSMMDTVTELSVDGNPNKVQNFDLLLKDTKLLTLSLRFCGIAEDGAKSIAQRINLFAPELQLMHLNLSSNFLGDEGVASIAKALRVNRSLIILNLADNQITDKGCERIVESLQSFALKVFEIRLRRMRIYDYYKRKQELLDTIMLSKSKVAVNVSTHSNKRSKESVRRNKEHELKKEKSGLKTASSTTSSKTAGSARSKSQTSRSETEKMNCMRTEEILSVDLHPFVKDTNTIDGEWYCFGNNKLMSLNLAYNKITQVGLRMLNRMLLYQNSTFGLPNIGIVRICLEGNSAPNCCSEMNEILELITHKNNSVHGSLNSRNRPSITSQQ